jgi:hypothetical protein
MLAWRQDPVRVEGVLERQVQPQRRVGRYRRRGAALLAVQAAEYPWRKL